MVYSPYQKKNPGDVLKLQDWLEIQQRIKEELRDHRHLGIDRDGEVEPQSIGPLIGSDGFEPGAVTFGKLALGSVGQLALAPGAVHGYHIDPDVRLPESLLLFREQGGHDHDGILSRALPADSVRTQQMQDNIIREEHLEGAPADNDLSEEEETYARGRAFTPGNVLRAARQLVEHTKMKNRPLLLSGDYVAIEGTSIIIRGFLLDRLVGTDDASADYLFVEFHPTGADIVRAQAEVLAAGRLRSDVPALGNIPTTGYLHVVHGAGTESLPWTPVTNAVAFAYQPAEN